MQSARARLSTREPWLYKLALQEIENATVGLCQKLPPDLCKIIGAHNYTRVEEELMNYAEMHDDIITRLHHEISTHPHWNGLERETGLWCFRCPHGCRRWHWVCDCDLDNLVERGLMPAYDVDPGSQFDYWDGSWEFLD